MLEDTEMNEHEELLWRRLRARVYSKRSVEKKKTTINELRQELAALERQYRTLVDKSADVNSSQEEAGSSLLSRFHRLPALKERLCRENQELQAIMSERMMQEARLQQVVDMRGSPPLVELPFHFRPLTVDQCREPLESCRNDALRFASRRKRQSSGLEVVGWRDYRHVVGDMVEFSLEKTFENVSVADLADRTWALLMNPEMCCRTYSSTTRVRLELLQHIDENTALFYRRIQTPGSLVISKTVFLRAWLPIPNGFFIASRSIDPDLIGFHDDGLNRMIEELKDPASRDASESWTAINHWMMMEEVSPTSCKLSFGGSAKAVWIVELLLICMRGESIVLGSRLLPSSR